MASGPKVSMLLTVLWISKHRFRLKSVENRPIRIADHIAFICYHHVMWQAFFPVCVSITRSLGLYRNPANSEEYWGEATIYKQQGKDLFTGFGRNGDRPAFNSSAVRGWEARRTSSRRSYTGTVAENCKYR